MEIAKMTGEHYEKTFVSINGLQTKNSGFIKVYLKKTCHTQRMLYY
jgi:hypothetical protein